MLGSLVLRCFQNLMALFWMFRRRGYWPNSALHPLFGVFLWTLSILLQKSKCRVSIGCFSQFKKSNFIEGPHTSLPYNAIGSITEFPVALLSSVACELAPLRIVLLCVFLYLFFLFFLLLF